VPETSSQHLDLNAVTTGYRSKDRAM